ncbi:hypothetical protein R0137_06050 [Congregibacter brevis]|uniref:Uncharacterized protein n=1 Tax=Congregibacter brevis TaxID=3081201 RepID=A0ABZ0IGC2_9GAMM|nr:hypothetical protein R0137_06050 [Congregibacter sp. IMCC45268]
MSHHMDNASRSRKIPQGLVSRAFQAAAGVQTAIEEIEKAKDALARAQRAVRDRMIDRTHAESNYNREVRALAPWVCRCFHINPATRELVNALGTPNERDNVSAVSLWIDRYIAEVGARSQPLTDCELLASMRNLLCDYFPPHMMGDLDDLFDGMEEE